MGGEKDQQSFLDVADSMEIDDEVIEQFEISFTDSTMSLSLLQFPTMLNINRVPDTASFKGTKLKMELHLELDGEFYSKDQGTEFGRGVGSRPIATAIDDFQSSYSQNQQVLEKISLESISVPITSRYMVGVFTDDLKLHMSSVNSVLQLRPTLDYMDSIREKEKQADQRIHAHEQSPEFEEEGKTYQVTTRGADPEAEKKASMQQLRKMLDDTPWVSANVHQMNSEQSAMEWENLFIQSEDKKDEIQFIENVTYIDEICPLVQDEYKSILGDKGRDEITELAAKITSIMVNGDLVVILAHVVDFATMKRVLRTKISDHKIVECLLLCCVIMNGLFVVKSGLIYKDRPFSSRQCLLKMFLHSEHISRKDIPGWLLPDMSLNMLRELAVLEKCGWRLKVLPDIDFQKDNYKLCEDQAQIITTEASLALELINAGPEKPKVARRSSIKPLTQSINSTIVINPTKKIDYSIISITGKTAHEQATKFISAILQCGPASFRIIEEALESRKNLVDTRNLIASYDLNQENIQTLLDEIAITIHGLWILNKTGIAAVDCVRDVVITMFKEKMQFKKSDVMIKCKLVNSIEPTAAIYTKVMQELGTTKGNFWSLKNL